MPDGSTHIVRTAGPLAVDGAAGPCASRIMEGQQDRPWPAGAETHPRHACGHPNRHEFYCWTSKDDAVQQRELMARNPHYARLYVSEVYAGSLGGWAWAVCWSCSPLVDEG
jgi:hypothetical protein